MSAQRVSLIFSPLTSGSDAGGSVRLLSLVLRAIRLHQNGILNALLRPGTHLPSITAPRSAGTGAFLPV